MKFNLTPLRRIYSDTGAFKSLTEIDLQLLNDGDVDTNGIDLNSETMAIICDLGARHRLSFMKYYRSPATVENVSFFGKQGEDEAHPWETITHSGSGNVLTADLSKVADKYEFLKVVHTVITDSATVYELEVITDDIDISFGEDGQAVLFSVDSGTTTLGAEQLWVYNPTGAMHRFFCLLDAEVEESIGVGISPTFSGTFEALHESGVSIPNTFSWSSGQMEDVVESDDNLVLVSGISGSYYTPVIDISSLDGRRLFWYTTLSGSNAIDDTARDDSVFTVSARYSNITPTDVGWISGQLSNDSLWSTTSGSLMFEPYDNYHIFNPKYLDYLQIKLDFHSPVDGETPILHSVGVEEGIPLDIDPQQSGILFTKSRLIDHEPSRTTNLLVWFFETDNEKQ